jgi:hypothetical protein
LKTYEYALESSTGPVTIAITHDDHGNPVGVDFGGYDPDFDRAFRAMGGKLLRDADEISKFVHVIDLTDKSIKIHTIAGIMGPWLAAETRLAAAMTLGEDSRASILSIVGQSTKSYHAFLKHWGNEALLALLETVVDQEKLTHVLKPVLTRFDFEVFFAAFRKLDQSHAARVMESYQSSTYTLEEHRKLAIASSELIRYKIVTILMHSLGYYYVRADIAKAIDTAIDIADSCIDPRIRSITVVKILFHTMSGMLSDDQVERIATLIVTTPPTAFAHYDVESIIRKKALFGAEISNIILGHLVGLGSER